MFRSKIRIAIPKMWQVCQMQCNPCTSTQLSPHISCCTRVQRCCVLELNCDGLSESVTWRSHAYNSWPDTDARTACNKHRHWFTCVLRSSQWLMSSGAQVTGGIPGRHDACLKRIKMVKLVGQTWVLIAWRNHKLYYPWTVTLGGRCWTSLDYR